MRWIFDPQSVLIQYLKIIRISRDPDLEINWIKIELSYRMNHTKIPTVQLEIPGKAFLKSETRTSVTFQLYFLTLPVI